MAIKVPQYGVQKVQTDRISPVRSNIDAPVEAFGGGKANPAEAIGNVAKTAGDIVTTANENANNVFNKGIKNELDRFHTSQFGENGAFQSRGIQANQAADDLQRNFEKKRNELLGRANNDEQRAYINFAAENSWNLMDKQMKVHAFNEYKEYEKAATANSISLNQDLMVLNHKDPDQLRSSMVSMMQAVSTYGHAQGMPPEQIEQLTNENLSKANTKVVERYVSTNDIQGGKNYYDKNKFLFHGDDVSKVENMLKEGHSNSQAEKYALDIVKEHNDTYAALQAAREQIKDPDVLAKTETKIKVQMKEKNEAPKKVYDNRLLSAVKSVDETGQVSASITGGLLPEGKAALDNYILWKKGAKQVKSDNTVYLEYSSKSMVDMEKVSEADLLLEVKPNVTNDQFKSVAEKWTIAREGLNGDPTAKTRFNATDADRTSQLAAMKDAGVMDNDDTMKSINKDAEKRKKMINFESAVNAQIQNEMAANGGKKLSDEEKKTIYNSVLKNTVSLKSGWFSDEDVPAISVTPETLSKVRIDDRAKSYMMNVARANGIIPPNASEGSAFKQLKENMQRAIVYGSQNGPFDTDMKKAKLIQILRGGEGVN